MIRHIEWLAQAEADLDDLPWRVAADATGMPANPASTA